MQVSRIVTCAVALAVIVSHPAFAQAAGGDPGGILQSFVNFFEGTFGVAIASLLLIVLAIMMALGHHRIEALVMICLAIAIYFGAPGLIAAIAH